MAQLKGGSVADFADSMAEAIEKALEREWQTVKGTTLPQDGQADRRLLFASIARGILNYLKAHQNEVMTGITLDAIQHTVNSLDLNIPNP
jgi:hypothetical protein